MNPTIERIDELVTEITGDLWDKFINYRQGLKRSDAMLTHIIRELAIERAMNEILKKKICH